MALLGAVNRFKFLKPVTPGQELRIETRKTDRGWPDGVYRRHGVGGWRDGSERRVVGSIELMSERMTRRMTRRKMAWASRDGKLSDSRAAVRNRFAEGEP